MFCVICALVAINNNVKAEERVRTERKKIVSKTTHKNRLLLPKAQLKKLSLDKKRALVQELQAIMVELERHQYAYGMKYVGLEAGSNINISFLGKAYAEGLPPGAPADASLSPQQCIIGGHLKDKIDGRCPTRANPCGTGDNFECAEIFGKACVSRLPLDHLSKRCATSDMAMQMSEDDLNIALFRATEDLSKMKEICEGVTEAKNNETLGCNWLLKRLKLIPDGAPLAGKEAAAEEEEEEEEAIEQEDNDTLKINSSCGGTLNNLNANHNCKAKLNKFDCSEERPHLALAAVPIISCSYESIECYEKSFMGCYTRDSYDKEIGLCKANQKKQDVHKNRRTFNIKNDQCFKVTQELNRAGCLDKVDAKTNCKTDVRDPSKIYVNCDIKIKNTCKLIKKDQACPSGYKPSRALDRDFIRWHWKESKTICVKDESPIKVNRSNK
jgi:hypothetical protein